MDSPAPFFDLKGLQRALQRIQKPEMGDVIFGVHCHLDDTIILLPFPVKSPRKPNPAPPRIDDRAECGTIVRGANRQYRGPTPRYSERSATRVHPKSTSRPARRDRADRDHEYPRPTTNWRRHEARRAVKAAIDDFSDQIVRQPRRKYSDPLIDFLEIILDYLVTN